MCTVEMQELSLCTQEIFNIKYSYIQIEEHKKFGGVVPELAARAHLENIEYIIGTAFKESKISIDEVDGVAATAGPGLIVCLTVGLNIGKSMVSIAREKYTWSSVGDLYFSLIKSFQ